MRAQEQHFKTKAETLDFLVSFLRSEVCQDSGCRAVWAPFTFLDGVDRENLWAEVAGLSFEVTRESAASARVGISQVNWAISNTGTLLQDAAAVEDRLVSTLPSVHVALVPGNGIQPDMAAALKRIHPRQSRYISMITGPSRTADIERVLTIGAHGPQRLMVIFVDELGAN